MPQIRSIRTPRAIPATTTPQTMHRQKMQTRAAGTYTVQVKDRVMLAHSFQGDEFGPAQQLHGMTAVVHAAFIGSDVDVPSNTLMDIGVAFSLLASALDPYRYQNLDSLLEFEGQNTTVECLCRAVWESIVQKLLCRMNSSKSTPFEHIERLRIRIEETDVALAEYEAPVQTRRKQILLDMDGVLYSCPGVASQIIQGLESAAQRLGLAEEEAQKLHEAYGSVARGLMTEGLLSDDESIKTFYMNAYRSIDLSVLKPNRLLQAQLEMLADTGDVDWWLATNSPPQFVKRILHALRINPSRFHIVCPSATNSWANKPSMEFYEQLPKVNSCFFDDSLMNVNGATSAGMTAVHVEGKAEVMALVADHLGVAPCHWRLGKAEYLRAKEHADLQSLNSKVLDELVVQLAQETSASEMAGESIRILDIGSGMLSMLPVILKSLGKSTAAVEYVAVDTDTDILKLASVRLQKEFAAEPSTSKGETPQAEIPIRSWVSHDPREDVTEKSNSNGASWSFHDGKRQVNVTLRSDDMLEILQEPVAKRYHLIVGCSILDLVDVRAAAAALELQHAGTLLYFPIHYVGVTAFQTSNTDIQQLTDKYNDSLVARCQITRIDRLLPCLGETLSVGSSAWTLDAKENASFFYQLVSFMATNALGYFPRERVQQAVEALTVRGHSQTEDVQIPQLLVENVDYLGRAVAKAAPDAYVADSSPQHRCLAVEFVAPHTVCVVDEPLPQRKPSEATVRAVCSAISAGTETKVLSARFAEEGQLLDTNIQSLSTQQSWPIRYGYCMVGRVEASESYVPGTRVFCFHPHASIMNVPDSSLLAIPEDISDEDAVLFASMETACSLVQDALPVLGDRVAIFGAGTVGTLAAAILAHKGQDVILFDPKATRLAPVLGKYPHLQPGSKSDSFDVAIEVSGSDSALARAIEGVNRGGRLVIGSFYGSDVSLPLGLRFHRSEVVIVTSQVSTVAGPLSTRWPKPRRAALTWQMLREIRPMEWLTTKQVPLEQAPSVYTQLVQGDDDAVTQVLFTYASCAD